MPLDPWDPRLHQPIPPRTPPLPAPPEPDPQTIGDWRREMERGGQYQWDPDKGGFVDNPDYRPPSGSPSNNPVPSPSQGAVSPAIGRSGEKYDIYYGGPRLGGIHTWPAEPPVYRGPALNHHIEPWFGQPGGYDRWRQTQPPSKPPPVRKTIGQMTPEERQRWLRQEAEYRQARQDWYGRNGKQGFSPEFRYEPDEGQLDDNPANRQMLSDPDYNPEDPGFLAWLRQNNHDKNGSVGGNPISSFGPYGAWQRYRQQLGGSGSNNAARPPLPTPPMPTGPAYKPTQVGSNQNGHGWAMPKPEQTWNGGSVNLDLGSGQQSGDQGRWTYGLNSSQLTDWMNKPQQGRPFMSEGERYQRGQALNSWLQNYNNLAEQHPNTYNPAPAWHGVDENGLPYKNKLQPARPAGMYTYDPTKYKSGRYF